MPERAGPTLRAASPVHPEDSVVVRQRRTEERPVETRCSSLDPSLLQPSLFLGWSVRRTLVASLRSVRGACHGYECKPSYEDARWLPGLRNDTVTTSTRYKTVRDVADISKGETGEKGVEKGRNELAGSLRALRPHRCNLRTGLWVCRPVSFDSLLLSYLHTLSSLSVSLCLCAWRRAKGG